MNKQNAILFKGWGYKRPLRKDYVVRGLTLEIKRGERVLLLGSSGIGKSTLLCAIAGVLGNNEAYLSSSSQREDEDGGLTEGDLLVEGLHPQQARGRCALMMQDPEAQMVLQRVGDNVAFGLENLGIERGEIWRRVRESLKRVGLSDIELSRSTSHLSGGQKQRVALAGAIAMRPSILLLDEPTANLDPKGAKEVSRACHEVLKEDPATVILVEHRADNWLDILNRVVILGRDSEGMVKVAADGTPDEIFSDPSIDFDSLGIWIPSKFALAKLQRKRLEDQIRIKAQSDFDPNFEALKNRDLTDRGSGKNLITPSIRFARKREFERGEVVVRAKGLSIGYNGKSIADDVSFAFESGKITILAGENGAGKSTLAMTVSGLMAPVGGEVEVSPSLARGLKGSPISWTSRQLCRRIAYVFQNPEHQFVRNTVLEEVMVGFLETGSKKEEARGLAHSLLKRFDLDRYSGANPYTLSGGEKRRLTVASSLASSPEVLILDEPTFGQDRSTWLEIVMLMRSVADSGVAVVAVTHDKELIEFLSDKVLTIGDKEGCDIRVKGANERKEKERPASLSPLLSRLNPAIRFLCAFLLSIPLFLSLDPLSAGLALALEFLFMEGCGISLKQALKHVWPIFAMAPWTFLAVVIYGKKGSVTYFEWGMIHVTNKSVYLAFATFLRVLAIAVPAVLLVLGIDSTDLADAASQILRLPERFVYGGLAGIRLFTVLSDDWLQIGQARRSRGLGDRKKAVRFFTQSFSLLILSIRRSTSLSTAMEARGFGGEGKRSWARLSRTSYRDWVALSVCALIPASALLLAYYCGTFALGGK
ncbi:MAG: ATP-binding cassette domain-containing protein [Aeriscardovia sp.]|nr:ATP-binding cassette domain-containing protein [Aeriscardovia sp.]